MNWISGLSRRTLSVIALVLGAVILLSVNIAAREKLAGVRADFTAEKLYTLSDSTRTVLAKLDDPISLKLYYTEDLGTAAPAYAAYARRIHSLLSQYANLSGGQLNYERIEPKQFSDDEDLAVAAGLRGVSLGQGRGAGYLGLVGSNSTDDREIIAFMSLDRADFLEYDLTRLILKLSNPKRKTVALLTGMEMSGGIDRRGRRLRPWLVMGQLKTFFNIKQLGPSFDKVPQEADVLMIASPEALDDKTAYAIDQFVLSGKPVLVLADPYSEVRRNGSAALPKDHKLVALLEKWGAKILTGKVVGDLKNSRRVQMGNALLPQVVNYVVWQIHQTRSFNASDPIFAKINRLVIATPGILQPVKGAGPQFTPLLQTSSTAQVIDAKALVPPDPAKLLDAYIPGKNRLVLAARLLGGAKSLYPEGPPKAAKKPDGKKPDAKKADAKKADGKKPDAKKADGKKADETKPAAKHLKSGRVNAIVIADADFLHDTFWSQVREVQGRRVAIPRANNIDLVLNSLENLSGGAALSGLRGRGVVQRPFNVVNDIERNAQKRYRARENLLKAKLKQAEQRLSKIQARSSGGKIILSEEDKTAIMSFRSEVVGVRQQLRDVKAALRRDIDNLEQRITFINIAGIPLIIVFGAMIWLFVRRRRSRRPAKRGAQA